MTTISPVLQDLAPSIRAVFRHLHAKSCPYTYNFHLHTTCSDGKLAPEDLIQQAIAHGLQGLAITDHHSVGGYQRAKTWLEQWQQHNQQPTPHLWTGVEISAGLMDVDVHILAYGFDPVHPALVPYLLGYTTMDDDYPAQQVITAIHQAGGLAVLAHPARYRRSLAELIAAAAALGIDGVETYYCYTNPKPWQPSPEQTETVGTLAKRFGLLETCGTDTHGLDILQRL